MALILKASPLFFSHAYSICRCKVLGVSGLRVVDCSVMPFVPSGNTHAAAVMIGEKAADMIIADHSA